jgi:hypothetical protein
MEDNPEISDCSDIDEEEDNDESSENEDDEVQEDDHHDNIEEKGENLGNETVTEFSKEQHKQNIIKIVNNKM